MRILLEILLVVVIALFAYKAFGWLFPSKTKKGRDEKEVKEQIKTETETEKPEEGVKIEEVESVQGVKIEEVKNAQEGVLETKVDEVKQEPVVETETKTQEGEIQKEEEKDAAQSQ